MFEVDAQHARVVYTILNYSVYYIFMDHFSLYKVVLCPGEFYVNVTQVNVI